MKKFIIVIAILFIANLGCKIMDDGGGLCACSPVRPSPYLSLVIKNSVGEDLLNATTAGSFAQNQIQLYTKDVNDVVKQISFSIRPPLSSNNEKFNYQQLLSQEIVILAKSIDNKFYLKLGTGEPLAVNLQVIENVNKVEKVLINNKEIPK